LDTGHHHFVTAADLVQQLGGRVDGDPSTRVHRFASLAKARLGEASFLSNPKYQSQLASTKASLLIVTQASVAREAGLNCAVIEANDPYLYFAKAASFLLEKIRSQEVTESVIHDSAVIDPSARIGKRVRIGPQVVIGPKALIGDGCDLGAGCVLGAQVQLGAHSLLHPRVVIYEGCAIGERAIIHSGAVIGADGFGFAPRPDKSWMKIPQVGAVRIGHDVEVGANTTIDRGTLEDTEIGNGVKLDNQIQVAHNVKIGDHTAIAACVGIAGSAVIGPYCQIGGAAGVLGHLTIAAGVVIGPMSLVTSSIHEPGKYVGAYPLQPQSQWEKSAAIVRRLPELRKAVQKLGK
jgi:UDP-3-O-[3-hydroxymyristoyl] glucosamine N-acyltransferase